MLHTSRQDDHTVHGILRRAIGVVEGPLGVRVSIQQTALIADVGVALNAEDALPTILQTCAEAVVRHLDAAFARIWTLNRVTDTLELQASAGRYTHLDGPHSRVPVGALKIGLIAAERRPHLTNDVPHDPRVSDKEWAAREGMIAFAGYPLIVGERLVGVLAMFARHTLGEETLAMISSVAQMIATGIARKEVEEQQRVDSQISETLYRIGMVLASERDLHTLVQAVTDAATEVTGAQYGSFFYNVVADADESYLLYTLSGVSSEAFARFPMPRNTVIFGPTFAGEGIVRLADVTQDPRYGQSAPYFGMPEGHLPVRSYLAVPVISRSGEVIGGLFFGHATPGIFTERAERIVAGIAAQAAVAIDNARLLQETQDAEVRFRTLFTRVPDAILVADSAGHYLDANPAATILLGYSHEELMHLSVEDVVIAETSWTQEEYARFVETGAWRDELDVRRKDGVAVPVEAQATAVALPTGTFYLSVLRDISARRRSEREQQDFIAMVAHDLKNPLTSLKGHAQLMRRRGTFSERSLTTIVSQADRLERLIDDLRDVTRIDVGQIPLERTNVDICALLHERATAAEALTQTHTIHVETPEIPVIGWWDADRLAQVLDNLITNAMKYSPEGGDIEVRVAVTREDVCVSVSDRGIGIAPEAQERLFERFYRAEGGIAADKKGLGLGLYISKALVEAHGGRMSAEPRDGGGSIFSFTLPLTQPKTG